MSNLIGPTGYRKMFTFSEMGHDEDMFLTENYMSEDHWQLLMGCHHSGQCDQDTEEAAKYFQFPSDEATINACNYLIGCGIERERFCDDLRYPEKVTDMNQIKDEDAVMQYYLWILAGDIQERSEEA